MNDDETFEEAALALAAELTRKAMEPWDRVLHEDEKRVMRLLLESELLADPEGRRQLRLALADPEMGASADVARGTEAKKDQERSGQ